MEEQYSFRQVEVTELVAVFTRRLLDKGADRNYIVEALIVVADKLTKMQRALEERNLGGKDDFTDKAAGI